jgi:hypothetical protein
MYQLTRQRGPIEEVTFEIEFLDPGIEAFSFTFGYFPAQNGSFWVKQGRSPRKSAFKACRTPDLLMSEAVGSLAGECSMLLWFERWVPEVIALAAQPERHFHAKNGPNERRWTPVLLLAWRTRSHIACCHSRIWANW